MHAWNMPRQPWIKFLQTVFEKAILDLILARREAQHIDQDKTTA